MPKVQKVQVPKVPTDAEDEEEEEVQVVEIEHEGKTYYVQNQEVFTKKGWKYG